MKKRMLKKSIAVAMAATMLFSVAGCGKKTDNKEEKTENTKEMVFQGEDFVLEGIEGDISSVYVKNDRLYLNTYEWVEETGISDTDSEDESAKEDQENTSEETTSEGEENTSEETTSEGEENTSEETTSEGEENTSEETTSEGEEDASEETAGEEDIPDEEDFEEIKGTSINRLYSANIDGSDVKEIPLPSIEENEWMQSISIGTDNSIAFLLSSYDQKTEKNSYSLIKIDEQGNELLNADITKVLNMNQENYISKMLMDDKGRFVIAMDQAVYILDENGKSADEIKSENYLEGMAMTKDGKIICASSVYTEESGSAQIQILDLDSKKWGETIKLDLRYFSGSDSLIDGIEYDFYYKDDSGIYGYDIAGKKSVKIIDYVASDITSENSWGIVPIAKDKLLGTTYDENGTKMVLYSKVDPSTIADKKVITFGAMWIDDNIKKAAIEFNKTSNEYRIEFKDYSNEEDPITKMNADIIAGNIPDIIGLSNLPIEQYVSKGMLEDLTPYFEKDSEIHTDDILDSVLETMKINDKLYYVAPSFGISTMVASKKDVGDGTGWTFDEMKALLEEKGDGVRPFYTENKSDMLYSFLGSGLTDFVDWQTGECSFDSQDFRDILEICNTKGRNEETEYNEDSPSTPSLIKDGKILFIEGWVSPEEVQVYKKMFDGDISYIGYPNKEKQGSYFQFDSQIGIYAKSEVKDGAWEFIRTFMTKEYQGSSMNVYNTPTRKDCFDMMMKAKTTTKEYTDELGQEVQPLDSSWGWDDLEIEIKPLSQEEADLYINLVNSIKKSGSYDESMMEIVQEEAKAYFAGEKSLDETVQIIQNRIKTYVNENR